jgi:hypothetical protein
VLEQDKQGLYQCVKYTPQPYPSNAASKEAVGLKPDESGSSRRLRSLGSAVSTCSLLATGPGLCTCSPLIPAVARLVDAQANSAAQCTPLL